MQDAPELGQAGPADRTRVIDPKHRMLIAVEGHRLAVALQLAPGRVEVVDGGFRVHEAQLHQAAGGIVDVHQQRADRAAILEPMVVRAVDLDQLPETVTPVPRLVDRRVALLAACARAPPT